MAMIARIWQNGIALFSHDTEIETAPVYDARPCFIHPSV
jgi:hypothetical protein